MVAQSTFHWEEYLHRNSSLSEDVCGGAIFISGSVHQL